MPTLMTILQAVSGCSGTTSEIEVVKNVASIAAVPLALFTFWLGFRQKERERTGSYYHKVVTDVVVPPTVEFFSRYVPKLRQAGQEVLNAQNAKRKTLPRQSMQVLADFSTDLFDLLSSIEDRTIVFDRFITDEIRSEFEKLQDNASEWFDEAVNRRRKNAEDLAFILQEGQQAIIKLLYRGQFFTGGSLIRYRRYWAWIRRRSGKTN